MERASRNRRWRRSRASSAIIPPNGQARVVFGMSGEPRRLPPDVELGLYRIAQEAVSNALRHAAATRIDVEISYRGETLLCIQDDGQGFTVPARPGALAQAAHYGLMGMVERAEHMGAQFRIDSAPGKGTRISVGVPPR